MRSRRIAALIAAGMLTVPACSPTVCTAIGWINATEVHVDDPSGRMVALQLCVEGECVGGDAVLPSDTPGVVAPSPAAYAVDELREGTWGLSFDLAAPSRIELRALDSVGNVITDRVFDLEWTRTEGSGSCPGRRRPTSSSSRWGETGRASERGVGCAGSVIPATRRVLGADTPGRYRITDLGHRRREVRSRTCTR